jgi:hypothetical protein
MPNLLKQIPETMRKQGFPEETIALLGLPADGYSSEAVMSLINRMDGLLTEEQCLSVMQEQGCCKTGNPAAPHRAFGIENAGKPLAEKVELLNKASIAHKAPSHLNDDGTLSVSWGVEDLKKKSCPCGVIKKLPESYEVPKTFCGCCGGHIRSNYQKSLGVKLRLKEIVSSSSSSGGKKRCEFLFEVEELK